MTDQRTIETQIAGLNALKERLSGSSFARSHITRLHSAAEALGTIATANDGSGERAHRLATASKKYLDAIQRTRADIEVRQAGGYASLSQEFAERVNLQPDRYANEIAQAFGRAEQKDRIAWLTKIAEEGDGRSLAAVQDAPEFVTGLDRETLAKFRGLMEQRHCPDIAEKRQVFNADVEVARGAIEQASRLAETALMIDDIDGAVAARERVQEAQAQFDAATT